MTADILIRGGTVVSEHEIRLSDVAISAGRVAALLEPGASCDAGQVIEAGGLFILPGVIDCHVHFNDPGRAHWEGFSTGTAAAAAGGTTTVIDMPLNSTPPTLNGEALRNKQDAVRAQAYVDYGLWGGLTPGNLDSLAELDAGGVFGYKAFMCNSGLDEYPAVDDAALFEGMKHSAKTGSVLLLHAENDCLTAHFGSQQRESGHVEPMAWAQARPDFTEEEAVQRALLLARVTGARVHFVHISSPASVRLVAAAKQRGVRATLETCPHYLALNEGDLARLGPVAKCAPPLRPAAIVEELWKTLLSGDIDCIASDHSPCSPDEKEKGQDDIWCAWGGIAGVQTLLGVLLTEGVHEARAAADRPGPHDVGQSRANVRLGAKEGLARARL